MPSPFPGMDPNLEQRGVWRSLRAHLLVSMANRIQREVDPRYWVSVEEILYHAVPDEEFLLGSRRASVLASVAAESRPVEVAVPVPEEVRERYLEIKEPRTGEVITAIGLLSPSNKRPGPGREAYLRKREAILGSRTNLVEIDLLRDGERMPVLRAPSGYDYSVLIHRSTRAARAALYPFTLREAAPTVPIPLRPGEAEPTIDLAALLVEVYDAGGFSLILDYSAPPNPPLPPDDEAWADALLRERGLR
ncbi:MAG: DUF4058 family protein [Armatimonadota bacterium]